ncbi:hypothetical protein RND81_05G091200 [Saponaria officinalis]|uniref:non-specific serine/threonine protein kinase n=2 Tax=Saponaria officinalis TaxID=3572 RepID=A0AAW1KTW3_SAPOF
MSSTSFDSGSDQAQDSNGAIFVLFIGIDIINMGLTIVVWVVVGFIYTMRVIAKIYRRMKEKGEAAQAAEAHFTVGENDNSIARHSEVQMQVNLPDETMERFLSDVAREKPTRFSSEELAICTRNFYQVLGSGGFGVVYKGDFQNGIQVAVKVLKDIAMVNDQFKAEVSTIGRTYHINLVRLYGFCFEPTMRALVYEYMEKGALDKVLFGSQRAQLRFEKLHEISIGIARGIAYLHEECRQRIIHYDIKPENVLLDVNLNPKVADFGLARLTNRGSTNMVVSGCRGTPGYAAPELWTPYTATYKCDVYSFGMVLFEIVGRRRNHDPNLSGESQEWVPKWAYDKFNNGELIQMLSALGIDRDDEREKAERMVKVALWCVQYLPNSRPKMSDVVKMLKGGVEIEPPQNPFAHLVDN